MRRSCAQLARKRRAKLQIKTQFNCVLRNHGGRSAGSPPTYDADAMLHAGVAAGSRLAIGMVSNSLEPPESLSTLPRTMPAGVHSSSVSGRNPHHSRAWNRDMLPVSPVGSVSKSGVVLPRWGFSSDSLARSTTAAARANDHFLSKLPVTTSAQANQPRFCLGLS
jgi:hypothetical protein